MARCIDYCAMLEGSGQHQGFGKLCQVNKDLKMVQISCLVNHNIQVVIQCSCVCVYVYAHVRGKHQTTQYGECSGL